MSENDAVATFLGPFGKWQLRSTLLIFLVKIPSSWFMACLIFTAKSPIPGEIYCKPPSGVPINNSTLWILSAHSKTFNKVENEESYNFCLIYHDAAGKYKNRDYEASSSLVECTAFEHRPMFYSIIHQYDLFCSREALVALTQSFHLLGVLIGGIISFYMLKRVSPRRTMLIGMIAQIFFGIATGYASVYEVHLFFRCSVAATCSMMCIGLMIVSDITTGKYRISAVCMFEQFWSIGVILLPGVASWWNSWGLIYVAITLPTLAIILLYYWIPDSPRWLLKHGKIEEAKLVLKEAAKVNKKFFSEDELCAQLVLLSELMRKEPPEPTLLSIWKGPLEIKLRLFVGHIGWSIYLMLYFSYLLNVRVMGRNYLEINTVVAGISEICGTFIGLYLILYTKRKWLWTSIFNILTSLIAFSANFLPESDPFERMLVYMATAMLAKVSVSSSLAIFSTSMGELVSKDKRSMCTYSGVTCSRTLVIIAPFIGYCVIFGQLVPQSIMSIMNICVSLLIATFIRTPRTIVPQPTVPNDEYEIGEHFIKK